MKRALTSVLAIAVATAAPARAEWKNGGCEGQWAAEMRRYAREQTHERLHRTLREAGKDADLHDTYLSARSLGDKDTVPLLIERLRLELGDTEPTPPPGVQYGFICTQVHLVDTLRSLTNTDQGMYYPRWAAWWQANREFSQRQWAINGFSEPGFHAANPIDERFALELMEVLGAPKRDYHWASALLLLTGEPAEMRMKWVGRAIDSGKRTLLLGALEVLGANKTKGDEVLIRKLASDADLGVRRRAASILYKRQRESRDSGSQTGLYCQALPSFSHSVAFLGNVLIVGQSNRVTAFDPSTRRTLWTQKAIPATSDLALVVGDRVIFATARGGMYALNSRGAVLWSKDPPLSKDHHIQRLLRRGEEIVVVRERTIEHVDANTGNTKSRVVAGSEIRDADAAQSAVYFVDRAGLHSSEGGLEFAGAVGVSASEKAVCVTVGESEKEGRVTCLGAEGATERWSKPLDDEGVGALVLERARVYVPARYSLTVFDVSDGSLLWTIEGGVGTMAASEQGLFLSGGDFDLRDPQTGEVLRTWPQIFGVRRIAVHGRYVAIASLDGVLWLIDLSGVAQTKTQIPLVPR